MGTERVESTHRRHRTSYNHMTENPIVSAVADYVDTPAADDEPGPAFLPRVHRIRRAAVVVADETLVRHALQHWVRALIEHAPGAPAPRVVPLQVVNGWKFGTLVAPMAFMRLAGPLLGVLDEHAAQDRRAARDRFAACAASYGGVHVAAHAPHLDPEGWTIELERSVRLTHDTPEAFRGLADGCVAALRLALGLARDPLVVVPLDVSSCGPDWVDAMSRAARELAHERVVFLVGWMECALGWEGLREAGFRVVRTP